MVCLINGGSASAKRNCLGLPPGSRPGHHHGLAQLRQSSVQTIHYFDPNKSSRLKLTTATYGGPAGATSTRPTLPARTRTEWGVTPNKGFEIKLSKKEDGDLFDHLRDAEIIRAGPPKEGEAKSDFRDRQLDMALEYLRGQIRTTARKDVKR